MTTSTSDYKQALVSDTSKDTASSMSDAPAPEVNPDMVAPRDVKPEVVQTPPPPPPRREHVAPGNRNSSSPTDELTQRLSVVEDKLQFILNTFGNLSMIGRPRVDRRNDDRQGRPQRPLPRSQRDDDGKRRQGPRQQRKAKIAAKTTNRMI